MHHYYYKVIVKIHANVLCCAVIRQLNDMFTKNMHR